MEACSAEDERMWPNTRLLDLLGIEAPIIQAPMAGAVSAEMVIPVSEAGGLGSLPCAMLTPEQARNDLGIISSLVCTLRCLNSLVRLHR